MFGHQIRCGETHCTRCRKKRNPKKASLIPVALSGSQTLASTEWVWSDPIWSSATPAHRAAEGQGHPGVTSTCQRRSVEGGDYISTRGDRLKSEASRDLECQSGEQQGTPTFRLSVDEKWSMSRAHSQTLLWTVHTNRHMHLRRVIKFETVTSKPVTSPNRQESWWIDSPSNNDTNFANIALMCCSLKAPEEVISRGAWM